MAYSPQLKCVEPLIAVVNLFLLGYDSDHFMLERRHNANSPQLKCLEPVIAVVNLLLLGYDIDHFMLGGTKKYCLQSLIKLFKTSHCSCQFV